MPSPPEKILGNNAYNNFDNKGLLYPRSNKHYFVDFKLYVVELYLSTDISYQELAIAEVISKLTIITRWTNDFKAAGPANIECLFKGTEEVPPPHKSSKSSS